MTAAAGHAHVPDSREEGANSSAGNRRPRACEAGTDTHPVPARRPYRVEILDVHGIAADHINVPSGLDAVAAARAAYPNALGFTVCAATGGVR